MPTLDWLHREAAFQTAARVPTRVLRPHAAGHVFGNPAQAGNLLMTLPLSRVVLSPTVTRPFFAVPRTSVARTASG